ncbi:hypothetical protein [Streptomyces sp. CNQ-509]|uniref:hypothetical protein n=1 Tax=Streptomyces sp. CNQ-509 TaxID=444103 RepID=UPI0020A6570A|nr:hypothetical protein [Streptomyces sp. CNQ-509]
MRRRLVHALAWTLATLAAVTVSWFGVRLVLDSTSDRPHTVPLSGRAPSSPPPLVGTATERPPPASPTPEPETPSAPESSQDPPERERRTASPEGTVGAEEGPGEGRQDQPAETATGDVQTYPVAGGRVTFEMAADSAELVSATPDAGWQMQTWEQTTWIRVDFVADNRRTSVICTWHDGPPRVETNEYAT